MAAGAAQATLVVMRLASAVYSLAAYAVFGIALVGAVLFLTGIGRPPLIDHGSSGPVAPALAIDLGLLLLFALQHTVMARTGFKARLARLLPPSAERSTFVLAASAVLLLLFAAWRPLPGVVWSATGTPALILGLVGWAGWLALVASTFMIDHLDLFGLRQGWAAFRRETYRAPRFQARWFYRWVRHPLMTSFLVVFWAVPRLTAGHALFSAAATAYVLVGIWFEERDLARTIPEYADYRRRVGGLIPRPARSAWER